MSRDCFICATIRASDRGENPGFIARLRTGYVVLYDRGQACRGYTIFQCRVCVDELHELTPRLRTEFLREMSLVSEALMLAFRPAKLNYELLGNSVPHLHWHLIPRYSDDPMRAVPVWENPDFVASLRQRPRSTVEELRETKLAVLGALRQVAASRIRRAFDTERPAR